MKSDELTFNILQKIKALMSDQELDALIEKFSQVDSNNDGKIEIDEFINAALIEEKIRLARMFEFTDADKDGCIKFEEFVAVKEPKFPILKKIRELGFENWVLITIGCCPLKRPSILLTH